MLVTIVLAGGEGKRMKSEIPKVLNTIKNKPMIHYVIQKALEINSDKIFIVVGKHEIEIKNSIYLGFPNDYTKFYFITQTDALGTGDAVKNCLPYTTTFDIFTKILILSADVPSIGIETLNELIKYDNAVLTHTKNNPFGCGRILLDEYGYIERIVEEKDCIEKQYLIELINCGIYVCTLKTLQLTMQIKNMNTASEYYLTDLIELGYNSGSLFKSVELPKVKSFEFFNINTYEELEIAKHILE
uniref:UDP-N-acetylglucosamine diphosphorylase n=1 Tax=viral metagenome TaxID=1070528 RepID=A0A6C0HYH4_9ZZZZ